MKSEAKTLKAQPSVSTVETGRGITAEELKILKAPFSKERLGVKVQTFNKDRTRAMLVLYLQHTDVQDRLEEVDPAWTTEVLKEERVGDTVYVRLRLTVKGISRENVGEGNDPKGAYSDALKRCAMLFGVGRYLYDSDTIWVDYDESRDRYRQWSIDDYERVSQGFVRESRESKETKPGLKTSSSMGKGEAVLGKSGSSTNKSEVVKSDSKGKEAKKSVARPREQLNRILMNLYRPYLTRFPETKFVDILTARYGVGETRLMTVEQMEDLVRYMEENLKSVA